LLDAITDRDMHMILPKDLPTLCAMGTGNYMRPDNVFVTTSILNTVVSCKTVPAEQPPMSNHFPVNTTLSLTLDLIQEQPRCNFRAVDWDEFRTVLKHETDKLHRGEHVESKTLFYRRLDKLTSTITRHSRRSSEDQTLTIHEEVVDKRTHKAAPRDKTSW
jgi:hypothetical protein